MIPSNNPLHYLYVFLFLVSLWFLYYLIRVCLVNGVKCPSKVRIDGKTVIITGGNTGIGKQTAFQLAKRGGRVIIACRDSTRGVSAVSEIKRESGSDTVFFKKLDLASIASIRLFATDVLETEERIDILLLNAGVMFTPYKLTEDGFELQFGVNHLGHFLLTHLLLDRIKKSSPSRIVVVSSLAHMVGYLDFDDMMWNKRYYRVLSYARSKLANIMFARELAKRVSGNGVTVCSLHPGVVDTGLTRDMYSGWFCYLKLLKPLICIAAILFAKTPKQGCQTSVYCATAWEVEGPLGAYYSNCHVLRPSKEALNDESCRQLWNLSMKSLNLNQEPEPHLYTTRIAIYKC